MSNTHCSIYLHLAFSTRHRRPLIRAEAREPLFRYLAGCVEGADWRPVATGGWTDHVHLLVRTGVAVDLPNFVKEAKRGSTIWLKSKFAGMEDFAWQRGYGAFSVSHWDVEKVAAYVRNQEEHHRRFTWEEECAKLLKKHGVEYDERYFLD